MLAISPDSIYAHKIEGQYSPNVHRVPFPVLADRTHTVSRIYGVFNPQDGTDFRGTFFIDPDGILRGYFIYNGSVGRSTEELLRALQAFQYVAATGRHTQAGWYPGLAALPPSWAHVGEY